MRKKVIKIFLIIICCILSAVNISCRPSPERKEKEFDFTQSKFKILQISDLHVMHYDGYNNLRYNLINELILKTDPDFIVLTGDNVDSTKTETAMKKLCSFVNNYKIPWTFVFGNHDSQRENNRQALADIGKSYNKCLFQDGPEDIDGIGNYVLELKDVNDEIVYSFIFFDTHGYNSSGGFDGIHENQIQWYKSYISNNLKDRAPSLIFMHIPFAEYKTAYDSIGNGATLFYGLRRDDVEYPKSSLFSTILELNNTKGVFCGHKHKNNYSIEYQGIRLTFCNTSNIEMGSKLDGVLGGTLITISKDKTFTVDPIFAKETFNKANK